MKTLVIDRSDINSAIHAHLWESICEELDLAPSTKHGKYPTQIELKVLSARDVDEDTGAV